MIGAVAPILPAQRPARLCAAILDRRDTDPAPPFSTAVNNGRMLRCIPLFHSYDDARSFIDEDYWATGARPCEIGTLQSEPDGLKEDLNDVIAGASLFDHCEYAVVMVGTDSEGNIRWRAFDIRPEALGLSSGPDLA